MQYRAYLYIDGQEYRVTPKRGSKTTHYPSIKAAERALERKARNNTFNSQGRIKDTEGNLLKTIAL